MDAADQPPKADIVHDEQNAVVSLLRCGLVVKREQDARDTLDEKEGKGDTPKAKVPSDGVLGYWFSEERFQGTPDVEPLVKPIPDTHPPIRTGRRLH
jgi:hypothetical protein